MRELTEPQQINAFRTSVIYGAKVNSLAEWMLSPEWTEVPATQTIRGSVHWRAGNGTKQVSGGDTASGEITC